MIFKNCDAVFNWGYTLMYKVIETPSFQKQAERLWTQDEHHAFIDWIAQNPTAGDIQNVKATDIDRSK